MGDYHQYVLRRASQRFAPHRFATQRRTQTRYGKNAVDASPESQCRVVEESDGLKQKQQ